MQGLGDLCWRFCRAHRVTLYRELTADFTRSVRVDDLVWRAGELWPGLVPTQAEVREEARRMQIDKDGREISQGLLVSQLLTDRRIGCHLILSMLQPTEEAHERLAAFVARGMVRPVHDRAHALDPLRATRWAAARPRAHPLDPRGRICDRARPRRRAS